MSDIDSFKRQIEAFLARTDWTPTRFGKEAAGDPLFVFQLRNGREPRSPTRARVMDFMKSQSSKSERAA